MNETLIQKHMNSLGITREEAIQLIEEDTAIDRMKTVKEINSDLSTEQVKASKVARQADRKPTVYKFDTSKRQKKENNSKRQLIAVLRSALEENGCSDIEVTNIEREIIFFSEGVKYKLVMSQPRS